MTDEELYKIYYSSALTQQEAFRAIFNAGRKAGLEEIANLAKEEKEFVSACITERDRGLFHAYEYRNCVPRRGGKDRMKPTRLERKPITFLLPVRTIDNARRQAKARDITLRAYLEEALGNAIAYPTGQPYARPNGEQYEDRHDVELLEAEV